MYYFWGEGLSLAREWLGSLRKGDWPRGCAVASRQARVLERIVAESEESERRAWEDFHQLEL